MSKSLLTQVKGLNPALLGARTVSIKLVAPAVHPDGHDEKNIALGRPQSPHLTIYQPQLTTMLSITHRGTGIYSFYYLFLSTRFFFFFFK